MSKSDSSSKHPYLLKWYNVNVRSASTGSPASSGAASASSGWTPGPSSSPPGAVYCYPVAGLLPGAAEAALLFAGLVGEEVVRGSVVRGLQRGLVLRQRTGQANCRIIVFSKSKFCSVELIFCRKCLFSSSCLCFFELTQSKYSWQGRYTYNLYIWTDLVEKCSLKLFIFREVEG